MSQSKLSVSPSLKSHFLEKPSWLNNKSQEELEEEIKKHREWQDNLDTTYYVKGLEIDDLPNRIGLPTLNAHDGSFTDEPIKTLSVIIKNTGDLPSTNVRVNLLLRTYGTKNFYPKNVIPKDLIEREVFSKHEVSISIPYMGPDDEREFTILHLHGQFREAELVLLKIRSNGFTYIKDNLLKKLFYSDAEIILSHYQMDRLKVKPLTQQSMKIIYGIEKQAPSTGYKEYRG